MDIIVTYLCIAKPTRSPILFFMHQTALYSQHWTEFQTFQLKKTHEMLRSWLTTEELEMLLIHENVYRKLGGLTEGLKDYSMALRSSFHFRVRVSWLELSYISLANGYRLGGGNLGNHTSAYIIFVSTKLFSISAISSSNLELSS